MLATILAAISFPVTAPTVQIESGSGLTVRTGSIPIIRGSWFQYYEPDWSRGYFSSQWEPQTVDRVDAQTTRVSFRSASGLASGSQTYRTEGNRITVDYRFQWAGDHPVRIEAAVGQIWATAVAQGSLTIDGQPTRPLTPQKFDQPGIDPRRFGPDGKLIDFATPIGRLAATCSIPLTAFDARGYDQPWAQSTPLIWVGALALDIAKDHPVAFTVSWTIPDAPVSGMRGEVTNLRPFPIPNAIAPTEDRLPIVPRPKINQLNWEKPLEVTGNWTLPAGRFNKFNPFIAALNRRFAFTPAIGASAVPIDGGESKISLKPGGYRIRIENGAISVLGQDQEGLRTAVERLAQLVFARDGKLWLPTGVLIDEPRRDFRGVHLFVGPQAIPFQRRLWTNVLRPLGFNNVVLQCERTDWQSAPEIKTSLTMSRADLAQLFQMYRNLDVEPTPLIQSFGHMEWLFANGKNRELAMDPDQPYAIDPRKPEAQDRIARIWAEAADLLHPKIMHFGLDEVDMLGFPKDPELMTSLWEKQLPFLGEIARKHDADPMLWGDMALGPGEGADAMNAPDAEHAARRRAAIPRNAMIADWHYKADEKPQPFIPSLQLWKREKFRPIASTWYTPNNVRAFVMAADIERVGTLQTTWAGYTSNEPAMLQNIEQFTAMVYAADYSWSGRSEPLEKLDYRAEDIFRRLYFGVPEPVAAIAGVGLGDGSSWRIGNVGFRKLNRPLALKNVLSGENRPGLLEIPITRNATSIALALDCENAMDQGQRIADLTVTLADGQVRTLGIDYGIHVRAADDERPTYAADREQGLSAVRLDLGPKPVRVVKVQLRAAGDVAGVRLHGITLW